MKKLYLSILFLLAGVGSVFSQDVEQAVRERLQAFSKRISLSMSISVHAGSTVYLSISTEKQSASMPIIHSPTSPSGRNGEQNLPGHQRNSSGSRNLLRHYCLYRRTFHQRTYSQHIQKRKKRQRAACLPIYTIKTLPG